MSDQTHIPLERAMLCLDCEELYMTCRPCCPVCGSTVWFPAFLWIRPHLKQHPHAKAISEPLKEPLND
jgi:hypothetical protein